MVLTLGLALAGCADIAGTAGWPAGPGAVSIRGLERAALSWHIPLYSDSLAGMRLVADAPRPALEVVAVTRAIVRSNPYLSVPDALELAAYAQNAASRAGVDEGFFSATLLQESAFAPDALSSAGAVGIAQFTLDTADAYGVDPFDWRSAIDGAARLLHGYLLAYGSLYPDPYAAALAAYNAGPGAVEHYHGVPPYPETQDYIQDVYDRWGRIERDMR